MEQSEAQLVHEILSGRQRGFAAAVVRAATAMAEPFYAATMVGRNWLYNCGTLHVHHLPRPVISVGNITAGGTGKTPMVCWLGGKLRDAGLHPAVLLRGYKKGSAAMSDEEAVLDRQLNGDGQPPIIVHAEPDRVAGGQKVLKEHPEVDVFLLDDGFQHRRLGRDLDLVLVDATNPFGYDHVHPRGLLREPLAGLGRAGAIVITRCDQVEAEQIQRIEQMARLHNAQSPIFHARHAHSGLRVAQASAAAASLPLEALAERRFFAFSGIANPQGLDRQLQKLPGQYVGHRWFPDHYAYRTSDLSQVEEQARAAGADTLLVTEKDWVKLSALPAPTSADLPIWRLELAIQFERDGEGQLLELVRQVAGAAVQAV